MRYIPAFHDTLGRELLLVGNGHAAAAKLAILRTSEAQVKVVTKHPEPCLLEAANHPRVQVMQRSLQPEDFDGPALVILADVGEEELALALTMTKQGSLPLNVVDRPEHCDFIMPAIIDRDPVVVAIGTQGTAPVLARRLRLRIEALLPERLGQLARFAASFRSAVRDTMASMEARGRFWRTFFDGPIAEDVLQGEETRAREAMIRLINGQNCKSEDGYHSEGQDWPEVLLSGEDLQEMTLRQARLLSEADWLVFEGEKAPRELARYLRRDAQVVNSKALSNGGSDRFGAGEKVVKLRLGPMPSVDQHLLAAL